jgi:1-acyl-sn-glycerol-3-phosphate acyltransferase
MLSKFWLAYFMLTILVEGFVFGTLICVPFYLLGRLWRPARAVADQVMQKGIFLLLKLQPWLRLRLQLSAWPDLPKGALIVANHRSHLDVFVLLAIVPGIRILARQSLFWIPGLNVMMWLSQQIRVGNRGPVSLMQAMARAQTKLQDHDTVMIFPELTRASAEVPTTLPFSLAPFRIACAQKCLIYPLVLENTAIAWPKGRKALASSTTVTARALSPVDARHFSDAQSLCHHVQEMMNVEIMNGRPA